MDVLLVCFVSALLGTLSATEFIRVLAHRLRAVDQPGGRRVHRRPTARLGGLGIYWGLCLSIALATYGSSHWPLPASGFDPNVLGLIGMMCGGGALLIVGLFDDVRGLPAPIKLALQVAAAVLLYVSGWRVETIGAPGFGAWHVGALSLPFTVAWVVLVTNALNLIDGLDGLACGVALAATLAACVLLWQRPGPALIAAVGLAGALLGFLWFNISPALIFMGDAGSLLVGFCLAAITLRAGQIASPEAFPLVPMLMLAVPLFDTLDAIRRRTVGAARASRSAFAFMRETRRRVFSPDGMHVHHRMLKAGLSTRRAVSLLWSAAASFALSGCMVTHDRSIGLLTFMGLGAMWWRGLALIERRLAPRPVLAVAPSSGAGEPDQGGGASPLDPPRAA